MTNSFVTGLTVAIMITTHNRVQDLRRTIAVLKALDPQPIEILITADGCIDSTVDEVIHSLPEARLFVNSPGKGSIASRHNMLCASSADLVLSLDDDSYPEQIQVISYLRRMFAESEQLSVAHFPQRSDEYPHTLSQIHIGDHKRTGSYPNSGACYRRKDYLALPGFPSIFFHAYEEPDYVLQVMSQGKSVEQHPCVTIRHHYSGQNRDEQRTHHQHARNELWSTVLRCPSPLMLLMIPYRVLSQARYAASRGPKWLIREPVWWLEAIIGIPQILRVRNPVSYKTYMLWLKLQRYPALIERKSQLSPSVRRDQ